jgi:hypothetical protein
VIRINEERTVTAAETKTQAGSDTQGTVDGTRRRSGSRRAASPGGRTRRTVRSADDVVASLTAMVDQLISENKRLKRELAQVERKAGAANLGQAAKTLSGLQRRVSRALAAPATSSRRRGSTQAGAAPRPRRRVTDPEVLQRRRDALAKARAALAAKRQSAKA